MSRHATLVRIDSCCDSVARRGSEVMEIGSLRLFVAPERSMPLYARPAAPGVVVAPDDISLARETQRRLGVPEAFEGSTSCIRR